MRINLQIETGRTKPWGCINCYGRMGILSDLFISKIVPETKGKSLEEIEKIWKKKIA